MSIEEVPANEIQFEEICSLLKQLQKKRKERQEQDKILATFFNDIRFKIAKIADKKNSSLFPILRLLLPHRDRERNSYNLKEKRLGELLVKVLSLPKQSEDAKKLLNFRSVQSISNNSDFAGVAYFVLKNRIPHKASSISIGNLNDLLDKVAPAEGTKANLDGALSYALKKLTVEQVTWFLRIILKDMKIGMSERRILAAFDLDAPEFFDVCVDLKKVCEEFSDGDSRPLELGVQLHRAINPMRSERLNITDIYKLSPNKSYVIEDKFDGERFQMHMNDGVFDYFSRKGKPYSSCYGKTYDSGLLTPYLKDCFSGDVKNIILDGEMMGWNKQYQYLEPKGRGFDVKQLTEKSIYQPCFCVFDIIFYNGKCLVGPPEKGGLSLKERLKLLDPAFTAVPGMILHSERKSVTVSDDILDALKAAEKNRLEGIVVKDVDSYYIPRKQNAGWYKMKPEYTQGAMPDLDLVVIGADEAQNKRQGRVQSFYVACLDAASGGARRWVCVGRVYTGLTYSERDELCAKLAAHWTATTQVAPPPCLCFNKKKPDLWLLPDNSVVLELRARKLIHSKDYGATYTLDFPCIVKIRKDKPVADVMTLEDFHELASQNNASEVKLGSKRANSDQTGDSNNPNIKILRKRSANVQVGEQFRIKAAGEVQVTSQALLGRKLCVLSEDADCSKAELIKIVESHGGIHVQNIGADTWCSVAGKITERVKRSIAQRVDIATTTWLRSLPQSDCLATLAPMHLLATSKHTEIALALQYDRYGDSYTEYTDEDTLKKCFEKMNDELPIYLTKKEMLQVDKILFKDEDSYSFLRQCNIYVRKPLYALTARMYGATLCDLNSANLTHVVLGKDSKVEDMDEIRRNTSALIVSEEWLKASFSGKKLAPHVPFLLL